MPAIIDWYEIATRLYNATMEYDHRVMVSAIEEYEEAVDRLEATDGSEKG
jgi:hypothetical protein